MVTLGLKGLPYFPHASLANHRLIELLEDEPSHLVLSRILATGAPDIAFLEVAAKCRTSIKELEPCATCERENEDAILDNDGWRLGFQTLKNDIPFCNPFMVVTAQCRFNVCTRHENTCADCTETDLMECAFPFRDGNLPQDPASFEIRPALGLLGHEQHH